MDNSDPVSNCDATSLLALKAELYRKQEACKLAKTQQKFGPLKRMTLKGQVITSKKKDKHFSQTPKAPEDMYEEEMLQKSRMILEAKAKMYEQIVEKKVALDEDFSDNYLVDFERKELFKHATDVDECKAAKSDLAGDTCSSEKDSIPNVNLASTENSEKDSIPNVDLASTENSESVFHSPTNNHSSKGESQGCFFHNSQEEKTEPAESESTDGPVHYQNVQFNEIRDHGVGYFAFSKEERERQEQMELLKTLRQKTVENKQTTEKLKQKKQALLQSRLAKVCQRRNIDASVLQAYEQKEEEKDEVPEKVEPEQVSDTPTDNSKSGEPVTDSASLPKKVRPWDIGKSDLTSPIQTSKRRLKAAEKWIENKRAERNEEFAPPTFYFDGPGPKTKKWH